MDPAKYYMGHIDIDSLNIHPGQWIQVRLCVDKSGCPAAVLELRVKEDGTPELYSDDELHIKSFKEWEPQP